MEYLLTTKDNQVFAAFASGERSTFALPELDSNGNFIQYNQKTEYAFWGEKNTLPAQIREVTLQNHIAPALLDFKTTATVGKGIITYIERTEGDRIYKEIVNIPEIDDFLSANGYHEENMDKLIEFSTDFHWYENIFCEMIRSNGGKVIQINHLDCIFTRSGKKNKNGNVTHLYVSEKFGHTKERTVSPSDIQKIPYYNPAANQPKFGVHFKKPTPGFLYYPPAPWHSSELWMRLGTSIPLVKASAIRNAMDIKYHIQIPESYFISLYPQGQYSKEDREKAKKKIIEQLNDFLVGQTNSKKAVTTFYPVDPITGKEMPGIKIEPLTDPTNHSAYLDDDERATAAICSAHNVNPSLANILLRNSLSGQSGNQLRYAFDLWTQLYAYIPRQYILRPLYLVKKINGWNKDIKFGFKDLKLETLDANPTGSTNAI
jgi:hypothetical protein